MKKESNTDFKNFTGLKGERKRDREKAKEIKTVIEKERERERERDGKENSGKK